MTAQKEFKEKLMKARHYVDGEQQENLRRAKLENGFYNILNGEKISTSGRLSVTYAATGKQIATIPDVDRALLAIAISWARNACSGWDAVPFGRRKAILADLLSKIDAYSDELSGLLSAEQGVTPAEARWEIDLLTKAFGPALMQMEPNHKKEDVQPIKHSTTCYFPIDASGARSASILPVVLSFGKVLPALLAGGTLVLRPSPVSPLTVLRIAEIIRELLPPGVFNVVSSGDDLWPGMTSHPGIGLITFTRSEDVEKPPLESLAGTLELGEDDSRASTDLEGIALFGSVELVPVIRKPGRYGLASTLFEILSFRPVRMKTQVLVWSLARKAAYSSLVLR
jgi:aldehyde dehydrogenase (NAD+)